MDGTFIFQPFNLSPYLRFDEHYLLKRSNPHLMLYLSRRAHSMRVISLQSYLSLLARLKFPLTIICATPAWSTPEEISSNTGVVSQDNELGTRLLDIFASFSSEDASVPSQRIKSNVYTYFCLNVHCR